MFVSHSIGEYIFFRYVLLMYEENDNSFKAVKNTVKEEKLEYEYRCCCSAIDKRKLCENYYVEVLKSGK